MNMHIFVLAYEFVTLTMGSMYKFRRCI